MTNLESHPIKFQWLHHSVSFPTVMLRLTFIIDAWWHSGFLIFVCLYSKPILLLHCIFKGQFSGIVNIDLPVHTISSASFATEYCLLCTLKSLFFSYGSWFLTNGVLCVGTSQGFQWQQHYNLASCAYFTMASYMMAGSGQVSGSQSRGKGSSDQVWRQVGGGLWCYHKDPWRDIPTAFSCDPWGQGFYVRSSPWLGVNPGI